MATHHMPPLIVQRSGYAMFRNRREIMIAGVAIAAVAALAAVIAPKFAEFRSEIDRVDKEAKVESRRVDAEASRVAEIAVLSEEVQEQTRQLLQEALSEQMPIIAPYGVYPAKLRQIACPNTTAARPSVCGIEVDLHAKLVRVPPTCGTVQMRISLLRSVPGAVVGVYNEIENWVVADLLSLIPPDQNGVLQGTMEFSTRNPVYPGSKDDLVWEYAPRCGSVSTIKAFDETVLDE